MLRVEVAGQVVLLAGDVESEAQSDLVRSGTDLRADVLKVPHHGSADADPAFLAATGARVALVSVGAGNPYGHPAPDLLSVLSRSGMRVHRTDEQGDLAVVVADEGGWGVSGRGQAP